MIFIITARKKVQLLHPFACPQLGERLICTTSCYGQHPPFPDRTIPHRQHQAPVNRRAVHIQLDCFLVNIFI